MPLAIRSPRISRSWFPLLLATLLAFSITVAGLSVAAEQDDEFSLVLDHGHIDAFTLVHEEDQLRLRLQEDVTGHHVLHDADTVMLRVKDEAEITLPSPVPANMSFLGKAGAKVYFLPQTQDQNLIWPGWSTERLSSANYTGPMQIQITDVKGPGKVFLWQTGSFGDSKSVLDDEGYELPGDITAEINAHVHANWAFTKAGRYELTVQANGKNSAGHAVSSKPATYTFDVGTPGLDPDPNPNPDPDPGPDPGPDPTPKPDPKPDPAPEPTPAPGAVWNVANSTVNKYGATVLNNGHIDVASLLENGKLVTKIKDTTRTSTPIWRDPSKTILQLLPSSRDTVPTNSAYSFLGKSGDSFYQVTQVQQRNLLWPGWSTESIPTSATTGGVLWALTDMSGPGEFALYETDPFGQPSVLFNTRDGINAKDRFTIPKNTHAHGSWAFSKQGNYCLSMQRVAQTAAGKTVRDQQVMAIAVGRADVMNVDPAQCFKKVETDAPAIKPPKNNKKSGSKSKKDKSKDKNASPQGSEDAPVRKVEKTACTVEATILSAGHIDYSSLIIDGRLQSQIGDDTSGKKIYREPSETVLWLKPAAKVSLPTGYEKVGSAGTVVWQVPQTQNADLIWLGWSTEPLNSGNAIGPVTWRMDKVDGPGTVKVYLSGAFGGVQEVVLSGAGSSHAVTLGVHAHGNWAFSKEGIYRIQMTQSVKLPNGSRSSDTETMTVAVGNVDPASALSDPNCVDASTSTPSSPKTADNQTALVSAPQTDAPSAPGQVTSDLTPTPNPLEASSPGPQTQITAVQSPGSNGDEQVPTLLGALGGLLLLGSAGSGTLWVRRSTTAKVGITA